MVAVLVNDIICTNRHVVKGHTITERETRVSPCNAI
jgi:hypothetical protein